jgi:hypothetical protein
MREMPDMKEPRVAKMHCQEIMTSINIDTSDLFGGFLIRPLNKAAEIGMVRLLGMTNGPKRTVFQ